MNEDDIKIKYNMLNTDTYVASNNTDMMYYHEVMKAEDANEFRNAIVKEVNVHTEIKHWELIPIEQVPKV